MIKNWRHRYYLTLFWASVLSLSLAFLGEYAFAMKPCPLCLYQRYVWAGLGALSLLIALVPSWRRPWMVLVLGIYCLGLGALANYQVLVEEKIVSAPQVCKAQSAQAATVDDLWDHLQKAPPVACDLPPQKFLGLSMAAYGGLLGIFLAGFCFVVWFQTFGRKEDVHGL